LPASAEATPAARSPFTAAEAAICFALASALDVLSGLRSLPGLLQGDLLNPDSYMRLVRLRDIVRLGKPVHVVLRDGSGEGTLLHWSHFLDSLLLVLAAPLRLFLDTDAALHGAALVFGPISVGLLGAAAAWVMAPLADRGWRWMAAVLTALAMPVIAYGLPGVAHHHVLLGLVAAMLAGAAGRLAEGERAAGQMLGAWAAGGIWLSPESMPFILMAFGGGGAAWMLRPADPRIGAGMIRAGATFLLLTCLALAVDPPFAGYAAIEIDRISLVHVTLALGAFGVGIVLMALDPAGTAPWLRAGLGALAGAGIVVLWAALFPDLLRGTDGVSAAADISIMNGATEEMQPIGSVMQGVMTLLNGVLALLLLGWLALSRRSLLWAYAALCVAVILVLGFLHIRFTTYAAVAGAITLPVAISECSRLMGRHAPALQSLARVGLLVVALLANRADAAAALLTADAAAPKTSATCSKRGLAAMLAPYAGEVVLSDVNDVPELLYRTQVRTVGSLYHRSVANFMRLRAAWRSGPAETVPEAVRTTSATLILACPGAARSMMVADLPENTLMDRLGRREVPPWLREVAADGASGFVLYRIVRAEEGG
jgi:hypothetical protein